MYYYDNYATYTGILVNKATSKESGLNGLLVKRVDVLILA